MYEYYRKHCPIEMTKKTGKTGKHVEISRKVGWIGWRGSYHNSCQLCPFWSRLLRKCRGASSHPQQVRGKRGNSLGGKQLRNSSGTQGGSYIMASCSEGNGTSDAGEKFGNYLQNRIQQQLRKQKEIHIYIDLGGWQGRRTWLRHVHLLILSRKGTKESIPDVKNEEAEVSITKIEQSVSTSITVSTTISTILQLLPFLPALLRYFFILTMYPSAHWYLSRTPAFVAHLLTWRNLVGCSLVRREVLHLSSPQTSSDP